jgi:hypothetical protein
MEHSRIIFYISNCVLCFVGSEAGTCKEASKTYTTTICDDDPCVKACHKEGFTDGRCSVVFIRPVMWECICKKEC